MPQGACTEQWALEHPEALLELQRSYVEAGAGVLVTPTLGANGARWRDLDWRGIWRSTIGASPRSPAKPRRAGPWWPRGSGTHRTGHPPLWRDPF